MKFIIHKIYLYLYLSYIIIIIIIYFEMRLNSSRKNRLTKKSITVYLFWIFFFHALFIRISGTNPNILLGYKLLFFHFINLFNSLYSIHHRHINVHKNKVIWVIFPVRFKYFFQRLLTVHTSINYQRKMLL